jgi:predicted nucleic acid-binding protein
LIFCDSSFLVALYLGTQSHSKTAREIAVTFASGIPYPWLIELELCTALRRILADKRDLLSKTIRNIKAAQKEGILVECEPDFKRVTVYALELSERYTATLGLRTLDILHVATALELRADTLASFDIRQRKLAASVGLKLLPEQV